MNNTHATTTTTGALNFARLIEEAEALLIGEAAAGCSKCGNCTSENGPHAGQCADRTNAKHTTRRLVATAHS